ncbi:MAG: SDR family oxidoreductase [Lautropia sp.]|nr:SDR family oxidoreductase [Lautropia sp.]
MTDALHRASAPEESVQGGERGRGGLKVVITGASSGLGHALATELASRCPGSTFLLLGRRTERLAELASQLPPGTLTSFESVDVSDHLAIRAVSERFMAQHGVPDIVIASAGISAGTLTDEPEDRAVFAKVFAVNVQGMYDTFAPFVAPMRQAGRGTLVGIASVAGVRGLPGSGAYSGSKAAVSAYLESLRVELHGTGVSVVTISPGFIDTEMTRGNPYRMPFLMPAEQFARRAVDAIRARRRRVVIPWQMGCVAMLLRVLPAWLFDRLFAQAGRKPRQPGLGRSGD